MMNKTITINLGSINFYIDEDAYNELDSYLKKISASLDAESREETLRDIEARIAEIFIANQHIENEVINLKTVHKVIAVMGQPEDYQIDDDPQYESQKKNSKTSSANKTGKKLYRDIDHKTIGGVCAGLAYYLGIDRIWIRLIFLILLFPGILNTSLLPGGSTVLLIYAILWIVIPAAVTTSEKLEMRGDPIDIDNIERKVREEYENVKNKVKNTDYSGFEKFVNGIGKLIVGLLKVVGIIIGICIVLSAGLSLILLPVKLLLLGGIDNIHILNIPFYDFAGMPHWLIISLTLLIIGIPLFLLLLAGLKIISPKSKSIGIIGILILLGIWVLSFMPFLYFYAESASPFLHTYVMKKYEKHDLNMTSDTLVIQGIPNTFTDSTHNKIFTEKGKTYSTLVNFSLKQTPKTPEIGLKKYLRINNRDNTISMDDLVYRYRIENDSLFLDEKSIIPLSKEDIKKQRIRGTIHLPENSVFKIDKVSSALIHNFPSKFIGHYLTFQKNKIKCLDCNNSKH